MTFHRQYFGAFNFFCRLKVSFLKFIGNIFSDKISRIMIYHQEQFVMSTNDKCYFQNFKENSFVLSELKI